MAERWTMVSEQQAIAQAGADVELLPGEPVSYALGTDATVVMLDVGDRPHGSCVWSRDEVVLRGPVPGSTRQWMDAGEDGVPVILGFVRLPAGCFPLGRLQFDQGEFVLVDDNDGWPVRGEDRHRLAECLFRLDERLPWHMLDLVRPVMPEDLPEPIWTTELPHDPVRAMHQFVATWYADIPPVPHEAGNAPLQVPGPLLEFYRAAAGRREVLGIQDSILSHARVHHAGGLLLFAVENQGGFGLLIDPTGADPEVSYSENPGEVVGTRQSLSRFLLQFLLSEAAVTSPFDAYATVTDEQSRQIGRLLQPVPLSPMHWPTGLTRHYVRPGVVVAVRDRTDGTAAVWAGSRWRSALRPLRQRLPGFEWQRFSG
ncbi:hypothetical protein [Dactylosporangium sp. NPDC005555]|uniref:hypothetical protein n=1 Tax=Dactylosporangium sp. NPDC005555 TaxID=3154889 RepID=UPI0033A6E4BD